MQINLEPTTMPKTTEQLLAEFGPNKIHMHRYKAAPERWEIQAFGMAVSHQGPLVDALAKFVSIVSTMRKQMISTSPPPSSSGGTLEA